MRSLKALYTIPAHKSNVSDVRFFRSDMPIPNALAPSPSEVDTPMDNASDSHPENGATPALDECPSSTVSAANAEQEWKYRSGLYFASAGYDGFVRIWSADDWQLLRTLSTDNSKVMSVDFSSDAQLLASGTYNRNFQLFSMEEAV
jgi:U4/U6 small nuclear ribonucleoprotein PRP4